MKKLLVIGALIGMAAGGGRPVKIARSPKDAATGATNRPALQAPAAPSVARSLVPQFTVTNTNRPPFTNVPQKPRIGITVTYVASNLPGVHGYMLVWSDSLTNKLRYTNVVDYQLPDGKTHTNTILFDTNVPARWYGLFQF